MIPESFFTWADLVSYAGATLAVLTIVQFTKELPGIVKIPTRVWAYILSLLLGERMGMVKAIPIFLLSQFI